MHRFEDLKVWQKAIEIVEEVYTLSAGFPIEEKFGLTSQIRKCAVSVPSNIAEGAGRNTKGEFRNYLGIANGSCNELFTQLVISYRLKLVKEEVVQPILDKVNEIQKMNYSLIQSL